MWQLQGYLDDVTFNCSGGALKFDLFSFEEKNNFRKRLLWQEI